MRVFRIVARQNTDWLMSNFFFSSFINHWRPVFRLNTYPRRILMMFPVTLFCNEQVRWQVGSFGTSELK